MPTSVYLAIKYHLLASPPPAPAQTAAPEALPAGMTDLNVATRDELATIAGIGQQFADRIIRGRPYKTESELVGRRIVPLSTFERIQGMIGVAR